MTSPGDRVDADEGKAQSRASDVDRDSGTRLGESLREHATLEARLRETAREAEALYRASALLVDTTDVGRLLEKILDAIYEHFGHPICTVHLKSDSDGTLRVVGFRGHVPTDAQLENALEGPGIVARVARTGVPENVPDVRGDIDYVVAIEGTRSELAVPLVIGSDVIGVINVESPAVSAFNESDERVLTSFAEHAALAIHTAQLYERVRNQATRETLINSIISAVHRTNDMDEILKVPCVGLAAALNVQRTYISTIDWSTGTARFLHAYSADGSEVYTGDYSLAAMGELSERLWRGEHFAASDVFAEPILDDARETYERHGTRSLVYMPVVTQSDWHAFVLVCCNHVREWTPDEIAILRVVAEQVGTAFVQAELFERVVQSKREWERTFDAMSDGVLLVDVSGCVSGANSAAALLLRMAREDVTGLTCCSLFGVSGPSECPVHEALANGVRVLEQWTLPRIGRLTQVTVDPMSGGDKAVVVLRDVSELRRFQEDARRQSVLLSQIVSSSEDPIALLDREGKVLWCNDLLAAGIGGDASSLVGRSMRDLLAHDASHTAFAELARACDGEPRFFETALAGHNGASEHWMLATLTPVFDDMVLTGVLLIGRDITGHRRAVERAAVADKMRALGQLSSGVAHNFNNALSVILGRAQLLRRRIDDPAVLSELAVIEQVSHEASNTVRRIQNFARRRLHESHKTIDLKALVADTLEMTSTRWRVEANVRGVRYDVTFDAAEDAYLVLGNESELREVFVNLIFNSLDAMPVGGSLSITLCREGGYVVARVADSGSGVPEDAKHRVFEPFFTTKGIRGTGLGLPVSYGIVSRHEGRIEFETTCGSGTVFSVVLPMKETRDAVIELGPDVLELAPLQSAATILVVEDDNEVRETIERALRARGHEVVTVSSGLDALEALRTVDVDLLLTDLSMPEMNGLALIDTVRRQWPRLKVALMTGADFTYIDGVHDASGADIILQKPFEIDELCYLVETVMSSAPRSAL